MLVLVCLLSLLISIPGFIKKAGYSFFKGLIPGYNLYLFFSIIDFPIFLLIGISLGMVFLPDRMFFMTFLCILLPFIVNHAYGKGKISGLFTLFLPFIMYPVLAYFTGFYGYDVMETKDTFVFKNKIFCVFLAILSIYVYSNFTIIVDTNELIDKENIHYVNDIYMSDGRIYNDFLNEKEKKMYMFLLNNTKKFQSVHELDMDEAGCRDYNECSSMLNKAHEAMLVDHPELINYASYSWSYSDFSGFKLRLIFAVPNPVSVEFGEMKIQRIIDNIKEDTNDMNDLEKIRYVYDWIGENNTYDLTFTYTSKNQSIYNVFMKKNAVCAGFAKASQVIFQNIGIESYTITGNSTGPHMWNVVKLDDKYYFFDSTVSASARNKKTSWYYDGLKQDYMSTYTVDFPEWYPNISATEGLYIVS